MKEFAVYENSEKKRVAVKIGLCWPGFFLQILWLLLARLWERAAIFAGFQIAAILAAGITADSRVEFWATASVIAQVLVPLIIGCVIAESGNEWRRTNLRARGFKRIATLRADSKDEALAKVREMSPEELSQKNFKGRRRKRSRRRPQE